MPHRCAFADGLDCQIKIFGAKKQDDGEPEVWYIEFRMKGFLLGYVYIGRRDGYETDRFVIAVWGAFACLRL